MKKILSFLLMILIVLSITACDNTGDSGKVDCNQDPTHDSCTIDPVTCDEGYVMDDDGECKLEEEPPTIAEDYLEIYYLNDFHGGLEKDDDKLGISYIANLINTKKEENPDNVLFVVGGDILQGGAYSNYFNGKSTIELLNLSNLDAFTLGNHEFDWGLDVIESYKDDNVENGEADYPFLGANIFFKGTTNMPDWIDPYTIIQKGDHKVGIIGVMGYGLEGSIATSKIEDYEFGDPITSVEYYSEYLRVDENCDVIIVITHGASSTFNNTVTSLTGNQKVDAVFNGHSHSEYANKINDIPVVQSGDKGEKVGYVKLVFDDTTITSTATNLGLWDDALLHSVDTDVDALLQQYILEAGTVIGVTIIDSAADYSKNDLSAWLTELLNEATGSVIAFQNYGGTREPISQGDEISLGTLYEIWPFDNVIKTVELKGSVIKSLISTGAYTYSTEITTFDDETYYKVATNDYVFDKPELPFLNGDNIVYTGIVLRDLVEDELLLQAAIYTTFATDNPLLTTSLTSGSSETTTNP